MNTLVKCLAALVVTIPALALNPEPTATADEKDKQPETPVAIVLGPGQGTATPFRLGSARTGGGNIHVSQPNRDTLSVTMTGVGVARCHPCNPSVAHFTFDLAQNFEVVFHDPKVKSAKLVLWGRTVGLLRSDCHSCGPTTSRHSPLTTQSGTAEISTPGQAAISCGPTMILALGMPPREVSGGYNLSIHDREGPVWAPVLPAKYTLHQVFGITATHGKGLFCKPASIEFAPSPALDGEWISKKEPFHGAEKKDFGFQVILKVVADQEGNGKGDNQ